MMKVPLPKIISILLFLGQKHVRESGFFELSLLKLIGLQKGNHFMEEMKASGVMQIPMLKRF